MQLWAIIVDSFREALDRKIFWVLVGLTLLITTAMLSVGIESDRVTFMFGLWGVETPHFDPRTVAGRVHVVGSVVYLLLFALLGWVGVILMIIATSGAFPQMMERGAVDVLLSKPIGRPKLFLYKYLAGMVFVAIQAALFVGLTFLVMGFRWGVWVPRYFLCAPLLVLLFSYLYCVSVLVAVKTRSTVAAILLSLGAWIAFATPQTALQTFDQFPKLKKQDRVYAMIRLAAWIPPKTTDIPYIAARWARAGASVDIFPDTAMSSASTDDREQIDRARRMEEEALRKNPWVSIGSSLVFEAVVVLWAMASFTRKDY